MYNLLNHFRVTIWWHALAPQVFGWVYFCLLVQPVPDLPVMRFVQFSVALIGISAFGYLFNDWCDVETDRLSGKNNVLANKPAVLRAILVFAPLAAGMYSWKLLNAGAWANLFMGLQILALTAYSLPPARLKARSVWGALADAFYGHINPVLITLSVFLQQPIEWNLFAILFLIVLLSCLALKGFRNILTHQIEDRKKDRKAHINTFVNSIGALNSLDLVNLLLWVENVFTIALGVLLIVLFPPLITAWLLFPAVTYLKFSGWKLSYLPKRQLRFKFLFYLNDFYEAWLPLFLLIVLVVKQPVFYPLLIFHVVLFPRFITGLIMDVKTIAENFKTEEDY
ncbi:MAG: UbiA family prenyltransferase [Chitinophagales bacterium]|nr:UbiA family prenyltransferase [Chitinophagales bacterium]